MLKPFEFQFFLPVAVVPEQFRELLFAFFDFNIKRVSGKAVVMVSGGVDSSTLCYKAVREGYNVHTLTFIYGQKHGKEIHSSENICRHLGLRPNVVDLSSIKDLFGACALTDRDIEIPRVSASARNYETLSSTVVPNRNAIFLSLAVAYSQSIGCDTVFYGAHHSDRGVYPDCRPEFVRAFEEAERLATDNERLTIVAPFADMDKSEIIKLGASLGVPFKDTWSCYVGSRVHCGTCSSCRERKRAFIEAGVADPTEYEA